MRCTGTNRSGKPCGNQALAGSDRCGFHPRDDSGSTGNVLPSFGPEAKLAITIATPLLLLIGFFRESFFLETFKIKFIDYVETTDLALASIKFFVSIFLLTPALYAALALIALSFLLVLSIFVLGALLAIIIAGYTRYVFSQSFLPALEIVKRLISLYAKFATNQQAIQEKFRDLDHKRLGAIQLSERLTQSLDITIRKNKEEIQQLSQTLYAHIMKSLIYASRHLYSIAAVTTVLIGTLSVYHATTNGMQTLACAQKFHEKINQIGNGSNPGSSSALFSYWTSHGTYICPKEKTESQSATLFNPLQKLTEFAQELFSYPLVNLHRIRGTSPISGLILLATTSKYLLLYNPIIDASLVVPVASISSITYAPESPQPGATGDSDALRPIVLEKLVGTMASMGQSLENISRTDSDLGSVSNELVRLSKAILDLVQRANTGSSPTESQVLQLIREIEKITDVLESISRIGNGTNENSKRLELIGSLLESVATKIKQGDANPTAVYEELILVLDMIHNTISEFVRALDAPAPLLNKLENIHSQLIRLNDRMSILVSNNSGSFKTVASELQGINSAITATRSDLDSGFSATGREIDSINVLLKDRRTATQAYDPWRSEGCNAERLGPIRFESDRSTINSVTYQSSNKDKLSEIIQDFRNRSPNRIYVVGYADNSGTSRHNWELSKDRADAVSDQLRKQLPKLEYYQVGKGESFSVAAGVDPNDPDARVVFVFPCYDNATLQDPS